MRKLLLMIALVAVSGWSMQVKAQKEQGFFKRLAVGVSASTMGIGVDAATTLNRHFMLRAGVDIMPGYSFDTDVDVDVTSGTSAEVNVDGDLSRTQASLLLNVYPSKRSSFFIAGGFYVGGNKLVKIEGNSPELQELREQYGSQAGIIIGDYKLPINENGNVAGGIKVSSFRPYLGLGFGRAVPHKRVAFMFELGVQFHGTPKVYSDAGDLQELTNQLDSDDKFSDILDNLTVYPVLKFRLCGRIF